MSSSLQTLPVEMVYRILDHLDEIHLFFLINNVCQRLNHILDSYPRYQVILFSSLVYFYVHQLRYVFLLYWAAFFQFFLDINRTSYYEDAHWTWRCSIPQRSIATQYCNTESIYLLPSKSTFYFLDTEKSPSFE